MNDKNVVKMIFKVKVRNYFDLIKTKVTPVRKSPIHAT